MPIGEFHDTTYRLTGARMAECKLCHVNMNMISSSWLNGYIAKKNKLMLIIWLRIYLHQVWGQYIYIINNREESYFHDS